jgi:hypothetical protein
LSAKVPLDSQRLVSFTVYYLVDALFGDTKLLRYSLVRPVFNETQALYFFVSLLTFFGGFTLPVFTHGNILLDFYLHVKYHVGMEPAELDSYIIESYYEEEPMAKLTASLTRKFSVELSDGQWESAEASCSEEDDFRAPKPKESEEKYREAKARFHAAMRAEVKAQVDAEMKRQKEEVLRDPVEVFAEEVDAAYMHRDIDDEDKVIPETPPLPTEIVRTPLAEGQATFKVRWFEVAKTKSGDKYLKCFGKGNWKREWVPAWSDVAELLFGDIAEMDTGELQTPYPLEATVEMGEYKNPKSGKVSPSPQKVIEWTRVG